jgi:hypothetical protein
MLEDNPEYKFQLWGWFHFKKKNIQEYLKNLLYFALWKFFCQKKIVKNFNISEINIIVVVLEHICPTSANIFKFFSLDTGFLNSGHFNINNIINKRNLFLTSVLCLDHIFIKYQIWNEREIIFTDFWHFV